MNQKFPINWDTIKVVIFDIDGTLYTQSRLRKKMAYALLSHYSVRPWRLQDILILRHFRAEREKRTGHAGYDLENAQYIWCAEKGNYLIDRVKKVVDQWMFTFPNQYLATCTYPGTKSFFNKLRSVDIKIAIYSDYKAHDKLKAMDLEADMIVSSTDPEIDRLKPDPKGLLYIANKLEVSPQECLFIGDRQELDGECAINANMPYLIVDKKPFSSFDFYKQLENTLTPVLTALEPVKN
ncbi:HAD-superfamily hydrolase, subfamily IA, variant 1 [Hymenobacter roseosalivarius DSM 11622]|uniref:phosphoglycolate phosphatase n=1 Tax=Hymenobacter roseosalivarius DSM 11622 TaxID=645990 RepID=A0A1W1UHJ8_9BACT|nr:HAD family hydrolase [Hymenobacter roseosalivarius]SMB80502.1 HAD-superfamily hydrolase, subfamily IA, variant 1 [Hymenobacter roseosalivarius DSM 11622]